MNTLHSLFSWTLDASLRASPLAGAVLCLQTALRGHISARWRYALWLPVLFVLVAPVLPESRWSAEQWFVHQEALAVPDMTGADLIVDDTPMLEVSSSLPVINPALETSSRIDWQQVMALSWAIGFALLLVGGLGLYLLEMQRLRRSAVPVSSSLMTLMQGVARELKLRREPTVWLSPRVTSPAVTGLWRPVVLLPVDFEATFTRPEVALVLRHELMHLKRGDLPLNALFCVLQTLHWFNPLLWFVAARVRQDREAACDSQVLASATNDCRADYGLALLKVQTTCQPHGFSLGFVGMFGNHAAMKSRIAAIAHYQRAHPLRGLIAAAIIVGLGALGATRAEAPSFEIGAATFAQGDSIRITSVNRSDTLITVSGDYELASQDEAVLAFFITAREAQEAQKTETDPQQRIKVKKGKGAFTLVHPRPYPGLPHVSFYPVNGGEAIGGIYFGTKEEAEVSKLMTLRRATPKPTKTTSQAPAPTGKPVAFVDGHLILDSELEDTSKTQRQMILYKQRDNPTEATAQLAKLQATALDSLIDRQLVLAEFKKMGGTIKPEFVDEDIEKIIQSQFKGDREAFVLELEKSSQTLKTFKALREKMMIVQVMRSKHGGKPEPATPAEIEAYYTAHAARFTGKTEAKISTITLPKNTTSRDLSKRIANDLHAKLSAGADFAARAKEHSQDKRAQHGGAWDKMDIKAMSPTLRDAVVATKVGQLAPIIEDDSAFIILRVDERVDGTRKPLETVKADIEKAIKSERSAAAAEKWLAGLRAKADIRRF